MKKFKRSLLTEEAFDDMNDYNHYNQFDSLFFKYLTIDNDGAIYVWNIMPMVEHDEWDIVRRKDGMSGIAGFVSCVNNTCLDNWADCIAELV